MRTTCLFDVMAERGDSSDEEPTIAEDVVVTKYKMAGDMANRVFSNVYMIFFHFYLRYFKDCR